MDSALGADEGALQAELRVPGHAVVEEDLLPVRVRHRESVPVQHIEDLEQRFDLDAGEAEAAGQAEVEVHPRRVPLPVHRGERAGDHRPGLGAVRAGGLVVGEEEVGAVAAEGAAEGSAPVVPAEFVHFVAVVVCGDAPGGVEGGLRQAGGQAVVAEDR